ncbi:MAG: N-acetylglucosamine-6-phosphate deacetylase [Dehalococcoidia bacterium]
MIDPPLTIRASTVVTPMGVIEQGAVRVEGGRISAVDHIARLPMDGEVLAGALLLPGFIDLHMHGYGGHGFQRGPEETREAVRLVARTGVTTCYAGLGAGPSIEAIARTVAGAAEVVGTETGGARLAGVFMEGPFISVEKKGAWNAAHLRAPNVRELHELIAASQDRIRRVNVAPELPGAPAFICAAREAGIAVSIGHSNATCEQALAGVASGATITNHTYNAMSMLEHRAPGLVGATLTTDALLGELILDGVHVHPAAALALLRAKGSAGVVLITDGSAMTGMPDGTYEFNSRTVIVQDGSCRLPNGTLAGSVSAFDQDVRNAHTWLGVGPAELAAISSGNAARAMGIDDHTGAIAPGMDADLVLLDDDLHVIATVVGGRMVYRREEERP